MPASVILGHRSLVPAMNYLYSLYDALVSIGVPSEKARAVVDAMERDMGTTLATKQDLVLLRQEMRQDAQLLTKELAGLRTELRQEIENRHVLLDQKIDAMQLRLIVKLGSMIFLGFGATIAALRLWP